MKRQVLPEVVVEHAPHAQWMSLINTARYLDVSTMTINRYVSEAAYAYLNFPQPSVVVDRCYWSRQDIDAWMRSRVGEVSSRKRKSEAIA